MNVAARTITPDRILSRSVQYEDYDRMFSEVLGNAKAGRSVANAIFGPIGDPMNDYSTSLLVRRSITDRTPESLGITPKQHRSLLAAIVLGTTIASTLGYGNPSEPIDCPEGAARLMMDAIGYKSVEYGAIVALDVKHRPIARQVFAIGGQSECLMEPRSVMKYLLSVDASRYFLYHNHPSGSIDMSPEDHQLTQGMLKASRLMGFELLDHIILGCGQFRSIRESTGIWEIPLN
jgi:DNA repair protein RadC